MTAVAESLLFGDPEPRRVVRLTSLDARRRDTDVHDSSDAVAVAALPLATMSLLKDAAARDSLLSVVVALPDASLLCVRHCRFEHFSSKIRYTYLSPEAFFFVGLQNSSVRRFYDPSS